MLQEIKEKKHTTNNLQSENGLKFFVETSLC